MKTTKRLWPFVLADNKLAEAYLEKQARKGLILESVGAYGLWATYRKEEPQKRKYCVDGFKGTQEEQGRYIRMAKDAGWNYVTAQPGYIFFDAEPGTNPVPTQTEWREEYLQVRKGLWSFDLPIGIIVIGFLVLFGTVFGWLEVEAVPLDWPTIHSLGTFIFLLIGFIKAVWFYLKSEIALRRDVPMKQGSMRGAMLWGYGRAAVGLLWLLGLWYNCAVIMLDDLKRGVNPVSIAAGVMIACLIVFVVLGIRMTKTDELGRKVFKTDERSKSILILSGGCLIISFVIYMIVMAQSRL